MDIHFPRNQAYRAKWTKPTPANVSHNIIVDFAGPAWYKQPGKTGASSVEKLHYYRLEGASLEALNKLLEYDALRKEASDYEFKAALDKIFGKPPPPDNREAIAKKLAEEFSEVQRKGYRALLGLTDPAIQVRNYEDIINRAYKIYPRIAASKDAQDRTAILSIPENYKGEHFVPPGAVEISAEEFHGYDDYSTAFEFFKPQAEGAALPDDFDAAKHHAIPHQLPDFKSITHAYMLQGKALDDRWTFIKKRNEWFMPYQDFRDKFMRDIYANMAIEWLNPQHSSFRINEDIHEATRGLSCAISEPTAEDGRIGIYYRLGVDEWDKLREAFAADFSLREFKPTPMDGCEVHLVPNENSPLGLLVALELEKVGPYPKSPNDFGFEERPTLENHASFHPEMTGFPYMKIERYHEDQVKLLVFRMPPNVKAIEPPGTDFIALSPAAYAVLTGSAENPPTHAFWIGGKALELLTAYETELRDYAERDAGFRDHVLKIIRGAAPDAAFEEFRLRTYRTVGDHPRDLYITMKNADFETAKEILADHFKIAFVSKGMGHRQDYASIHLELQQDTENGRAITALVATVPYEPYYTRVLDDIFQFSTFGGYDQMRTKDFERTRQSFVLYHFPSYITNVEPPPHCLEIGREGYATMLVDEIDQYDRVSPPPRPAHLAHLPAAEQKQSPAVEGLPYHDDRGSEYWFKKPKQP